MPAVAGVLYLKKQRPFLSPSLSLHNFAVITRGRNGQCVVSICPPYRLIVASGHRQLDEDGAAVDHEGLEGENRTHLLSL